MSIIHSTPPAAIAATAPDRKEPAQQDSGLSWKGSTEATQQAGQKMPDAQASQSAIYAATGYIPPTVLLTEEDTALPLGAAEAQDKSPTKQQVIDEFLEYMNKSSAERLRDQILQSMGLTEEDLEALPPEERRAVEDTIAQKMREHIERTARGETPKAQELAQADAAATEAGNPRREEKDVLS